MIQTLIVNTFDLQRSSRYAGGPVMYEYFIKEGFIKKNDEQTRKHFRSACELNKDDMDVCLIPEIEFKNQATIINHVKSLIVDDFLNEVRQQGKDIRELWTN